VFLAAVRARIGTDWEASSTEQARTMDVTVVTDDEKSVARIAFVDGEGRAASRVVEGATCDEVVAGIALVTALAIESRTGKSADPNRAAGTDVPAAIEPPPSAGVESSPAVPSAPAASPGGDARSLQTKRAKTPWHVDLGAMVAARSGIGPAPAFGARLVGGIGHRRGPDLRLAIDYVTMPTTTVAKHGGIAMQTYEVGAAVSGCPFVLALGTRVRVLPCGGLAAGIIHAETRPSAGLGATGSGNPAFVAPFLELRAEVEWGAVFVEAGGDIRFVVNKPTFALDSPDDDPPLYQVPLVALGASLGLGLRL
jgi:hypothetical protein